MKVTIPPDLQTKIDAIRAWDVAVTGWLGLNPEELTKLDTDIEHGILTYQVAFDPTEPLVRPQPTRGRTSHPTIEGSSAGEYFIYTGKVALDHEEIVELLAAFGHRPSMFTPEQLVELEALKAMFQP